MMEHCFGTQKSVQYSLAHFKYLFMALLLLASATNKTYAPGQQMFGISKHIFQSMVRDGEKDEFQIRLSS